MSEHEHEWITVVGRRWCTCCDAYQVRKLDNGEWHPPFKAECPMTTVRARMLLEAAERASS